MHKKFRFIFFDDKGAAKVKTRLLSSIILSVAIVFATSAFAGGDKEKVQWADVPAAAQKTITYHAEGKAVQEIEKKTKTKHGKTVTTYKADVMQEDGEKMEIKVRADGQLRKIEFD